MGLVDLPTELLLVFPQHLHNIEDFVNLSSSCRTFHNVLTGTSPNTILHLAAASARVFFRPSPHFLVAATARQISHWALLSTKNYDDLREAFHGGMDSLLQLCVSKAGLTMDDIRRLHSSRFSIINPISDMIDRCAGKQWYDVPDFWNGGRSDANTIMVEPERSLFQIIIYGELFSSTMDAVVTPDAPTSRFDLDMRLDFIKYCIPDYMCWLGYDGGPDNNRAMEVLPVGPYTPCKRIDVMAPAEVDELTELERFNLATIDHAKGITADQVGLNHILTCRTWREAWEEVRFSIGLNFDEKWRQKLWHAAVQQQGWDGLEMLRPGGVEKWRGRLQEIIDSIRAMPASSMPKIYRYGSRALEASDAPCMADEILVCMIAM